MWGIRTKIDLSEHQNPENRAENRARGSSGAEQQRVYELSAVSGQGWMLLLGDLAEYARNTLESREPALITRERQQESARNDRESAPKSDFARRGGSGGPFAEELRLAGQS